MLSVVMLESLLGLCEIDRTASHSDPSPWQIWFSSKKNSSRTSLASYLPPILARKGCNAFAKKGGLDQACSGCPGRAGAGSRLNPDFTRMCLLEWVLGMEGPFLQDQACVPVCLTPLVP